MSSKLRIQTLVVAMSALAIAGCDTVDSRTGSPDPAFGETVKYNAAVQTIDPAPVYAEGGAQPGDSGAKGVAAVERYRTDAVKDVERIRTSSSTGGGGGPQ